MASPKHHRLSCEEIEELVPDLLYGELDAERAAEVRSRLPECELSEKVAGYESLRAALRSIPDEEPPASISAQLMHAAAQQVDGKATAGAGGGFWERVRAWLGPIGMHPGLAAAASLLLVAGVAGMLYMRGADRPVGPDVATQAEPPRSELARAPAATASLRGAALEESPTEGDIANDEDDIANGFGVEAGVEGGVAGGVVGGVLGGAPAGGLSKDAPEKPARSRDIVSKRSAKKRSRPREGSAKGSKLDVASGGGGLIGGLDDGAYGSGENERSYDRAKAEPAPAMEPEAKPTSPPPPKAGKSKKKPASSATLKQLHAKASAAASAGDCASVRALGAKIEKLDGVYYRDVFRRDSAIRACDGVRK